jgi:uncharacterized protein YjbI with pentapeptide repeats
VKALLESRRAAGVIQMHRSRIGTPWQHSSPLRHIGGFAGDNLTNANFTGARILGYSFANSDLTGANFTNSNATSANFTNAILSNVNFSGTLLTGATFTGAKSSGIVGIPASLPNGWVLVNGVFYG